MSPKFRICCLRFATSRVKPRPQRRNIRIPCTLRPRSGEGKKHQDSRPSAATSRLQLAFMQTGTIAALRRSETISRTSIGSFRAGSTSRALHGPESHARSEGARNDQEGEAGSGDSGDDPELIRHTWDGPNLRPPHGRPRKEGANVSNKIVAFIEKNKLQGFVIDFEQIPDDAHKDTLAFLSEVRAAFKPRGLARGGRRAFRRSALEL